MSKKKQDMCPLYPDMPCPRGQESAQSCQVRAEGDFDPMLDFRDYLLLNCALHRANAPAEKQEKGRE
jgi:hypothetical protein